MEQESIIDSIKDHLTLLETMVNWSIFAALATIVASVQKLDTMDIAGMRLTKRHVFVVMCVTFAGVNLATALAFFRIGLLLEMIDPLSAARATTVLATHRWILNPFANMGTGYTGSTISSLGLGSLIFVWWTCNSSLFTLTHARSSWTIQAMLASFLCAGILSMRSIEFAYSSLENLIVDLPNTERLQIVEKIESDYSLAYFAVAIGMAQAGGLVLVLHRGRNEK